MGIKALCDGVSLHDVIRAILLHTTTIGVRYHAVERSILARRQYTIVTKYGEIGIKEVTSPDGSVRSKPEYRDLHEISIAKGIPISELRAEVERVMTENRRKGKERG